jgi:hypothetical protein
VTTWDEAKMARDGHLSAGKVHPSEAPGLICIHGPVVEVLERDENGRPVRYITASGIEWGPRKRRTP